MIAPPPARPWRRAVSRTLLGAGVVLAAACVWLAVRAALAYAEVAALQRAADRFEHTLDGAQFDASFLDRVSGDAGALAGHAQTLASLTSDPIWRVAEHAPFAGPNLRAIRVGAAELAALTAAGRDILRSAGPVVTPTAAGGVDVDAIEALRAPLREAVAALGDARERLAALDRSHVVGPIAAALDLLDRGVARAGPAIEALHATSEIAPAMLGADGDRLILVMLQNPGELRAAGGIAGTFVAIRAKDGVLALEAQTDSESFPPAREPLLPVPDDASTWPDDDVARYVQNLSGTPDFALSAQLAAAWWRGYAGQQPDAVLSIDPLVLQPLLRVTGPVRAGGEQIAAEQVVDALLRRPYLERDRPEQAMFFAAVAEALFAAAMADAAHAAPIAYHVVPLVEEGRVALWSAHAREQAAIARSPVAGMRARIEQRDAHALLFDDLTGGKLGAYLSATFALDASACRADGRGTVLVRATLTSEVPPDILLPWTSFPAWGGFERDHIGVRLTALAPPGAIVEGVHLDGEPHAWSSATVIGRPGAATRIDVPPGDAVAVEFRFASAAQGADAHGAPAPALVHTPLVGDSPVAVTGGGCG
ncbi:DUF4012 domain-containing protein [Microbacterium sp. NPDC096154]|uniref:DUF4012 domain-containing protein n=1 Tax=Microbacterium sp. NPDC096154 TaxID=3155549 RepID=UPI003317A0DC